jgi:hypothetical protein
MRLLARGKSEQNQAALDPWTVVHLGMGVAAGMIKIPLGTALFAAVAYEITENLFERTETGKGLFAISGPESLANSLVDIGVYAAGWYWAWRWSQQ